MALPSVDILEQDVAVYLGGYLVRKMKEKFSGAVSTCENCVKLWLATGEEKEDLGQKIISKG